MPASRRRALSACSCAVALATFGLLAAGEIRAAAANHDVQRREARGLGAIRHDRAAGPAECASAGNRVPG